MLLDRMRPGEIMLRSVAVKVVQSPTGMWGDSMRVRFVSVSLLALALTPVLSGLVFGDTAAVLDESGFFRRYYRFGVSRYSPTALTREGETVLGQQGYARLQRDTERAMTAAGLDPRKADWKQHVVHTMFRHFRPVEAPPPADDWTSVDFDDSSWVGTRGFFQSGQSAAIANPGLGQFDESVDQRLQQAFYRARFVIEDPAAAGNLTLRLVFTGGARVFLNGQEVLRGGLPKEKIDPETPADDYPFEAYKPAGANLRDRAIGPVRVPADLVRKGVNILAVEVRASLFHPIVLTNPRQQNWGETSRPWPHARLSKLELRGDNAGVRSALVRPAGIQVWVQDMHHRTASDEFLPSGESSGTVRLVGPANATCSAQVIVGTDRNLAGLSASCSELRLVGGAATIPADAFRVFYPAPFPKSEWTMKRLGDERGLDASFPDNKTLAGYARMTDPGKTSIFDQLSPTPPATVPAGTCQPLWLSLRVPSDAAPGKYGGTVTVRADGVAPAQLPLELEVVGWRLPDSADFQTFAGCEENPYGVARQYGVKLWSDEHFKLLETSFRELGRVGNDWVNVPVLTQTEFGNRDDSMIRWIRKRDGSLAFDYTVLDRYLDLATKYWGRPRVIQFVVMHGMSSQTNPPAPPEVKVYEEATGRTTSLPLDGNRISPAEKAKSWEAFATALYQHMTARGQEKSMYWGYPLEQEADPDLKLLLAKFTPQVYWTTGPHEMMSNAKYAKAEEFYKVVTLIRYWAAWPNFRDDQGWKSKTVHLVNPRPGGTCIAMHTTSFPWPYRALADRALATGRTGFARIGADEWAAVHYDGMNVPRWLTGIPVLFVLWPGPDGAQSSQRFEALVEGVQEAEARIYLEQAVDRGGLPQPLAARVRKTLADHFAQTTFVQGNSIICALERYHYGWQERSAALYRLAAEVAATKTQ